MNSLSFTQLSRTIDPNNYPESRLDCPALIDDLKQAKAFNPEGILMLWPTWLTWDMVQEAVKQGYMTRTTYGPNTYAHTEYKLS